MDDVIDFAKYKKELDDQNVEEKIQEYSEKLKVALEAMDDILNDVEESGIDWFEVKKEHQDVMEVISNAYLYMETYLGWARHS